MIRITWPDGSTEEHATAEDFLEALRSSQWSDMTADDLRRVLAHRAEVWSETTLDVDREVTSKELLHGLALAGLLAFEVTA